METTGAEDLLRESGRDQSILIAREHKNLPNVSRGEVVLEESGLGQYSCSAQKRCGSLDRWRRTRSVPCIAPSAKVASGIFMLKTLDERVCYLLRGPIKNRRSSAQLL